MAVTKVRALTNPEEKLLKRNGINPEHCSVVHRDDDSIVLINHRTRDNIVIRRGERAWEKG